MRKLADSRPNLMCSLVHKFGYGGGSLNDFVKGLNEKPIEVYGDVFVFVDECHRTQSGKFHRVMKAILPEAVFFGFTGTPLLKEDASDTREVFGKVIHSYYYPEVVEDGVVLDLIYESREIPQDWGSQEHIDEWFDAVSEDLSPWEKRALQDHWGTMQKVLSSKGRKGRVVANIVRNFRTRPLAALRHIEEEHLRLFALDKLVWIKNQQQKFREQERESQREYIARESHWVWGNRYLMEIEHKPVCGVRYGFRKLILTVPEGMDREARGKVMAAWYRDQLREKLPGLLAQWLPRMGVPKPRILVQRMKTRWGSCRQESRIIRLNTDLARKPPACLEYILVHELAHLLEHTHNARFVGIMDRHLPNWRSYRHTLDTAPLAHVDWDY